MNGTIKNIGRFSALLGLGVIIETHNFYANPLYSSKRAETPNVILCMSDDQGWGDVGYNGHPDLKTPHLDSMSREGIRFDRWYAASAVCSPTRGGCLTGRNPYRYGVFYANTGHMKKEEVTLAEVCKTQGYMTGHFGKWHLGTLTKTIKDSNRGGPKNIKHYSPPWENGFDQCLSTEAKVPTWDPMVTDNGQDFYGTRYWKEDTTFIPVDDPSLKGCDSRIIVDRTIQFIQDAKTAGKPFFAVVWFHTPHKPVRAGKSYKDMYPGKTESEKNYRGSITAMDEQIGRLRSCLKDQGVDKNTLFWFCSDNGPTGRGITGGFRGRKRSLYEGGVRVPGLLVWPEKIKTARVEKFPCGVVDYFPTILDILGITPAPIVPVDGISLLPLLNGTMSTRPGYMGWQIKDKASIANQQYKLITTKGTNHELYDLIADKYEKTNIAAQNPDVVDTLEKVLKDFITSCENSNSGADYPQTSITSGTSFSDKNIFIQRSGAMLTITTCRKGIVRFFNIHGQQLSCHDINKGVSTIKMPRVSAGMLLVKCQTDDISVFKKIIFTK